jgi:type IV pilus assembly protein PilM
MSVSSMGRSRTSNFVGLTIEPGRIAAAHVSVNGSIVIQDGGRAELEPGVVRDGEVADSDALAEALRSLWSEHKHLDKRVRIGVANARIVVRTIHLPVIQDPKQLAVAVRFQAADEIPMPLDDAVLDFQSIGIVDTPEGPRQRIVLVAARREMILDTLKAARAAGLKPAGIDLSAFGMVRALQSPGADDGPELFVSVGGLTNLAVADRGICTFTRVAGSGLENLAVELAERRELTLEHARMWLHHVGLESEVEDIDGEEAIVADARTILTSGVRRIATEVRASLDFHQGQVEDGTSVRRVVLTGPAVAVGGFAAALEAELGLEVQERVVAGSKDMKLGSLDAACLSVAAGLAVEEGPSA